MSDSFEHDFKEMIRKSLKDEELTGDNQKDCENCKRKSELTIKKSRFKHLAPILILRANRFSKNNKNKALNKIKIEENLLISDILSLKESSNKIEEEIIPIEKLLEEEKNDLIQNFEEIKEEKESLLLKKDESNLKIDEFNLKNDCYSLYCIIVHKGVSNQCGHYFSIVKDFRDGSWFLIDDLKQQIEKIDLDFEFLTDETPYIFYYMREKIN